MVKGESNGVHENGTSPAAAKPNLPPPTATVPASAVEPKKRCLWFEEELEEDLRWVFGVSK